MTVLGIDLGTRRIGLAVSDPEERIAFPATTLASAGLEADLRAVASFARERAVAAVVVGLPVHMSGRRGPEARAAEAFAARLREELGVPVELQDERWTSREATRALAAGGRRSRERRGKVDALAATLLLRTWLERRGRSGPAS